MRYPDGGGLSAAGRARREKVRLQAAEWFAEGVTPPEVARRLRVSCNSAYAWRRRWRAGGVAALASRGPGGAVCRPDRVVVTAGLAWVQAVIDHIAVGVDELARARRAGRRRRLAGPDLEFRAFCTRKGLPVSSIRQLPRAWGA